MEKVVINICELGAGRQAMKWVSVLYICSTLTFLGNNRLWAYDRSCICSTPHLPCRVPLASSWNAVFFQACMTRSSIYRGGDDDDGINQQQDKCMHCLSLRTFDLICARRAGVSLSIIGPIHAFLGYRLVQVHGAEDQNHGYRLWHESHRFQKKSRCHLLK